MLALYIILHKLKREKKTKKTTKLLEVEEYFNAAKNKIQKQVSSSNTDGNNTYFRVFEIPV